MMTCLSWSSTAMEIKGQFSVKYSFKSHEYARIEIKREDHIIISKKLAYSPCSLNLKSWNTPVEHFEKDKNWLTVVVFCIKLEILKSRLLNMRTGNRPLFTTD